MSFQVLPTPVVTASGEVPFGILQQLLGSPLLMGSWSSRDSFIPLPFFPVGDIPFLLVGDIWLVVLVSIPLRGLEMWASNQDWASLLGNA